MEHTGNVTSKGTFSKW